MKTEVKTEVTSNPSIVKSANGDLQSREAQVWCSLALEMESPTKASAFFTEAIRSDYTHGLAWLGKGVVGNLSLESRLYVANRALVCYGRKFGNTNEYNLLYRLIETLQEDVQKKQKYLKRWEWWYRLALLGNIVLCLFLIY